MARKPAAAFSPPLPDPFRDHEDRIAFDLAGRERLWLLCRKSIRLAEAAGHPIEEIVDGLKGLREAPTLAKTYTVYGLIVWIGLLPFEPDADLEQITDLLTPADVRRLGPLLLTPLLSAGKEGKATGAETAP